MEETTPPTIERHRIRRSVLIVAGGFAIGGLVATVSAVRGGTGRAGLFLVLLVGALGSILAAADAAVLMLVDQYKGRTSTWRRLVLVVALGFSSAVLVAMLAGVADAS